MNGSYSFLHAMSHSSNNFSEHFRTIKTICFSKALLSENRPKRAICQHDLWKVYEDDFSIVISRDCGTNKMNSKNVVILACMGFSGLLISLGEVQMTYGLLQCWQNIPIFRNSTKSANHTTRILLWLKWCCNYERLSLACWWVKKLLEGVKAKQYRHC